MKNRSTAVIRNARNARKIARLEALGYEILAAPSIEFRSRELSLKELADLASPGVYDCVIFGDERAVESFQEIAEESSIDIYGYDEPTIVAIGEPVADRLRFLQLHADVIPSRIDPASVFESISAYFEGGRSLEDSSFLVAATVGTTRIPMGSLRAAGAEADTVFFSEIEVVKQNDLAKMKALVIGGGIDLVYFGSTYDVFEVEVLATCSLDLFEGGARAVCSDELTLAALGEAGLEAEMI
ncbi:MAG TPA: uroporphyrinogen-III synthase [Aridibacter sp.]|nr:uroporphyrinogen-III synthase [Aridibacter sp.]